MNHDRLMNFQSQRDQIDRDLMLMISEAGRGALTKERDRLDLVITRLSNNEPEPAEFNFKTPGGEISVYTNSDEPYNGIFVEINGEQAALIEHYGDDQLHKIHVWKHNEESEGDDRLLAVIFETGEMQ